MKRSTLYFPLFFFLFGCEQDEPVHFTPQVGDSSPKIASIELSEHNKLMAEQKKHLIDLQQRFDQVVAESHIRATEDAEIIKELEARIVNLNHSLGEYRSEISDSRNSLKEIKKMGSKEYKTIYEQSRNLDHEKAISLFEEFLEEFPNSPISSRARSRIKFHNAEIQVLENRKSARTVRLWEAKLKGEGMFARAVEEDEIFNLIGRKPDSAKRGSSSEYKERIYIWRDYILDGGYHDLMIETTDGKVDGISRSE
ncbi:MAG: hypothetical protein HN548_12335 [Opitutae bacterium]|jgi:hypothetical protein|nr:hypothetical protein [Opitutae bacterium]MBT5717098.1 hypothetical protein [Opitutae bacterium]